MTTTAEMALRLVVRLPIPLRVLALKTWLRWNLPGSEDVADYILFAAHLNRIAERGGR
jgi:hypothetical protein